MVLRRSESHNNQQHEFFNQKQHRKKASNEHFEFIQRFEHFKRVVLFFFICAFQRKSLVDWAAGNQTFFGENDRTFRQKRNQFLPGNHCTAIARLRRSHKQFQSKKLPFKTHCQNLQKR